MEGKFSIKDQERKQKTLIYQWKNYFLSVINDITSNPYAYEPGFMHVQSPSQSNDELALKVGLCTCVKPGSLAYGFDVISFVYLHTEIYFSI